MQWLRFKNIKIIYITPKRQLWGICAKGIKVCILRKVSDWVYLESFLKIKKIISYESSKLFKKSINFKFIFKGVRLVLKNKNIDISVLTVDCAVKELLSSSENSFFGISARKKNKCLALTKKNVQCNRLVLNSKYCFQHKKKELFTYVKSNGTSKEWDQYYTRSFVSKLCILWYCKTIKINKILDLVIEPSAGTGSFCIQIDKICINRVYLDIDPKCLNIEKKNFLDFKFEAKKFRKVHIIGNPPFKQLSKFLLKASEIGDFIGFILPKSFKKDSISKKMPFNFHCIFSEDLPHKSFILDNSFINVPTVFQIWRKELYPREIAKMQKSNFFFFCKKRR